MPTFRLATERARSSQIGELGLLTSSIPLLDRARQLVTIIRKASKYAPDVPVGVAMAIAENESRFRNDNPNRTSSAVGVWQILKGSAKKYGVTLAERTDPVKSTIGAMKLFQVYADWLKKNAPGLDPDNFAGLIYYAHSEGGGAMRQGVKRVQKAGKRVTLQNVVQARGRINPGPGLQKVMKRWRMWDRLPGAAVAGAGLLSVALIATAAYLIAKNREKGAKAMGDSDTTMLGDLFADEPFS